MQSTTFKITNNNSAEMGKNTKKGKSINCFVCTFVRVCLSACVCVCPLISLTVLSTAGLVNGSGHGYCSYSRRWFVLVLLLLYPRHGWSVRREIVQDFSARVKRSFKSTGDELQTLSKKKKNCVWRKPVWGPSGENLPPFLGVCHAVHWLLWVFALGNGGDLRPNIGKEKKKHDGSCGVGRWDGNQEVLSLTCTAWTCGDWMTDGCVAWITPWTCTVWPLGSCTSVTVGPVAEAWPAAMETCLTDTHADLEKVFWL